MVDLIRRISMQRGITNYMVRVISAAVVMMYSQHLAAAHTTVLHGRHESPVQQNAIVK